MTDPHTKMANQVAPQIREKIKATQGLTGADTAAKVRSVAAEIVKLLCSVGLAFLKRIPPDLTAIHPKNRDGLGAVAADVHTLLYIILSQGFIWAEISGKCWAVQKSPNPKIAAQQHQFNVEVVKKSKGLLAEPNPDAEVLTIAGTHTNQTARCTIHETQGILVQKDNTQSINFWTRDGRISKDKVLACNPAYGEFIAQGAEILVIRHQVESVLPELPDFLSHAANRGHGSERVPSKLQICLQICTMYEATQEDDTAEKIRVVKSNLRGRSWLNDKEIDALISFVLKWSGGTSDPWILKEIADRVYDRERSVEIPTALLGKLGALDGMSNCERWVRGVLMAIIDTPLKPGAGADVQKETSTLYSATDVEHGSKSLKPKIVEACKRMKEAEDWLNSGEGLDVKDLYRDFTTRLVNHIHGKRIPTRKTFTSVNELLHYFVDEVKKQEGAPSNPPKGWFQGEESAGSAGPAKTDHIIQIQYDESGQIKLETLAELGYIKDVQLLGPDGNVWKLSKVSAGMVTLSRVVGDATIRISCNNLVDTYKFYKPAKTMTFEVKDPLPTPIKQILSICRPTLPSHTLGIWGRAKAPGGEGPASLRVLRAPPSLLKGSPLGAKRQSPLFEF